MWFLFIIWAHSIAWIERGASAAMIEDREVFIKAEDTPRRRFESGWARFI